MLSNWTGLKFRCMVKSSVESRYFRTVKGLLTRENKKISYTTNFKAFADRRMSLVTERMKIYYPFTYNVFDQNDIITVIGRN